MSTQITLQELSVKLGGNFWEKGDLKRIYLDKGFNTKKMSTKTYVYEKQDGSFGVKCYIDCPSQPYQWIESQQDQVVESVERQIEEALEANVYVFQTPDGKFCNFDEKVDTVGELYRFFTTKKEADSEVENSISDYSKGAKLVAILKADFEKSEKEFYAKKQEQAILESDKKEAIKHQPVVSKIEENTTTPEYGVGTKVQHKKFGIGLVKSESDSKVEVLFDDSRLGTKNFLKDFITLTVVNE